jgi:beta-lactamase superfamily II metal-dependent hydrolase
MVWSLRIHHIDVVASGDATLIVARNDGVGPGHVAQTRCALIDGGRLMAAASVDAYVAAQVANVDVIAVTHYDIDHVNGILGLLNMVAAAPAGVATPYDNALIFDQGEPAVDDNTYQQYLNAVAAAGLTRVTRAVSSDPPVPVKVRLGAAVVPAVVPNVHTPLQTYLVNGVPAIFGVININPPAPLAVPIGAALGPAATVGWWHPYWLVGREILWTDQAGEPIAPASPGAPTITCIAVNRYVRTGPLTAAYRAAGLLAPTVKNEKSLAFEVRFGNFRYYVGGDIENFQETTIAAYLNQADTLAERVQVIKTSHHGANTATAPAFVARMRPQAAMISCGLANQYGHPTATTLHTLDGLNGLGAPVRQPVNYYLTGYLFPGQVMGAVVVPPQPYYAGPPAWAFTAGDPVVGVPFQFGDVVVKVSAVQSAASPLGLRANTMIAAIVATGAATGTATLPALRDDAIEAEHSTAPLATAVDATIASVLNSYGRAAPAAIAGAAIGGGFLATVPAAYALATGVGATPGEAAVTAAAAGVAVALDGTPPIAMAMLASLVTSTAVNLVPGAAAGAAAAGVAAQNAVNAVYNPRGQCTVRFYNRNAPLGPGRYSYHLH